MIIDYKRWLFLSGIFLIFLSLFNVFSFTGLAVFENEEAGIQEPRILERTAYSDKFFLGDNSYKLIAYGNAINVLDADGQYKPFSSLVDLTADENKLRLTWPDNSVDFYFYIKNHGRKLSLNEMNYSEKRRLNLRTNILNGRGFYYFNHTLNAEHYDSLSFGYDFVSESTICKAKNYSLICGDLKIDFLEAVATQDLMVDIDENSIELTGNDLSNIDPSVTIDKSSQTFVKKDDGFYTQQDDFVGFNGLTEYHRSWVDFNTSSIPDGSDITNVDFKFKTDYLNEEGCSGSGCTENFLKFYEMTIPCGTISQCWEKVDDETLYYTLSNMEEGEWEYREETVDIGSEAVNDLENRLNDDDFGVGLVGYESGGSDDIYVDFSSSSGYAPSIAVTYTPPPDETAPTTNISATYSSNSSISYTFEDIAMDYLSLTFSCDDGDGDGCNSTYYCIDTVNSCIPTMIYSTPFENNQEGTTYIRYYSDDLASNSESTQYKTMIIDKSGKLSIERGINNTLPLARVDEDLQIYLNYLNGSQMTGRFDKVASYGNQRWAFNYIITNESYTNIGNLMPSVYIWENDSLSSEEIEKQVEVLINSTLI